MNTTVTIRKAISGEAEKITDFITKFVEDGKLLPRTYNELDDLLDNFFIAELDGVIVGCAALEIYSKKLCEIRSLAVSPDVQGLGVGKMLVSACLNLAKQSNIFEVMAVSSAEAFFLACGFDFTLPGEKKAFFLQTRDTI